METLRTGVYALSVFLVLGGCLLMLLPSSRMQSAFRFLQSVMIVLLILSIVRIGINPDLDLTLPEGDVNENIAMSVQKSYLKAAEDSVRDLVAQNLAELHLKPEKILVEEDISEDGNIHIAYITVLLNRSDGDKVDAAYRLLKAEIGGEIAVKLQEVETNGTE